MRGTVKERQDEGDYQTLFTGQENEGGQILQKKNVCDEVF